MNDVSQNQVQKSQELDVSTPPDKCSLCASTDNLTTCYVSVTSCTIPVEDDTGYTTDLDGNIIHDMKIWHIGLCHECRCKVYKDVLRQFYSGMAFLLYGAGGIFIISLLLFIGLFWIKLHWGVQGSMNYLIIVGLVILGIIILLYTFPFFGGVHGYLLNFFGYLKFRRTGEPPLMSFAGTHPFEAAAWNIIEILEGKKPGKIFVDFRLPDMPKPEDIPMDDLSDEDNAEEIYQPFRQVMYSGPTPEYAANPESTYKFFRFGKAFIINK